MYLPIEQCLAQGHVIPYALLAGGTKYRLLIHHRAGEAFVRGALRQGYWRKAASPSINRVACRLVNHNLTQ